MDGWAATCAGTGCTCGCPDPCVDALGNSAWKDLVAGLKSKSLTHSHMGMNSAPVSELCCCAPFMLCKNSPKKYIVTMMGANDLVWYPGAFLMCCMNYPMCSFDLFMSHVNTFGNPNLKVVYLPDQVGWRHCGCTIHKKFYDQVKESAGTIVTITNTTTDVTAPGWTYEVKTNEDYTKCKHKNLIFLDADNAYQSLIEANGMKWAGEMEHTAQAYSHFNEWLMYVVGGMTGDTLATDWRIQAPPIQIGMDREISKE